MNSLKLFPFMNKGRLTGTDDLNNVLTSGIYEISAPTTGVLNGKDIQYGILIVFSAGQRIQLLGNGLYGNAYFRTGRDNGRWYDWVSIYWHKIYSKRELGELLGNPKGTKSFSSWSEFTDFVNEMPIKTIQPFVSNFNAFAGEGFYGNVVQGLVIKQLEDNVFLFGIAIDGTLIFRNRNYPDVSTWKDPKIIIHSNNWHKIYSKPDLGELLQNAYDSYSLKESIETEIGVGLGVYYITQPNLASLSCIVIINYDNYQVLGMKGNLSFSVSLLKLTVVSKVGDIDINVRKILKQ